MCETWTDSACRPVILSSRVVVRAAAVRLMVPLALTPGSGVSLNASGLAVVEGEGVGEVTGVGEGDVEDDPPPQATAQSAIAASHALAHFNPAQHRVRALPQQVTGSGLEFSFIPCRSLSAYACCSCRALRSRAIRSPV